MPLISESEIDVEETVNDEDRKSYLLNREVVTKYDVEFGTEYQQGELLGSGKFGDVLKCIELNTRCELAAKVIPVNSSQEKDLVMNEVTIMKKLLHPRLIQLYAVYVCAARITLVMELINGGELFERVIDTQFELNEAKCAKFMKQILQGVEYIHKQNVIHLDLKPENILCLSRTGFNIKIIDFGLAQMVEDREIRILFGTPEFVAPEVISYEPVTYAADMWSVGVICYVLLSGLSPFVGENMGETLSNVIKCVYSFDFPEFRQISKEAKSFIKKLLVKDTRERYTANKCLNHSWIEEKKEKIAIVDKANLKHFFYRRKWQKSVNAIIALQRMGVCLTQSPQISEIRKYLQRSRLVRHASLQPTNSAPSLSMRRSSLFAKLKTFNCISDRNSEKTTGNRFLLNKPPNVHVDARIILGKKLKKMNFFRGRQGGQKEIIDKRYVRKEPQTGKYDKVLKCSDNNMKDLDIIEGKSGAADHFMNEAVVGADSRISRAKIPNSDTSTSRNNTSVKNSKSVSSRDKYFTALNDENNRTKH